MIRAIALFAVLVVLGLFALLNWTAFAAVTPLSLGLTTVNAPLGLIMLGVVLFSALLFTLWAISMQAGALREARRQTRQLQAQRDLADRAEASRFTELRHFVAEEVANIMQLTEQARAMVMNSLDRLQSETRSSLEDSANSLTACLGQLEDRLERGQVLPGEPARNGLDMPLRR